MEKRTCLVRMTRQRAREHQNKETRIKDHS